MESLLDVWARILGGTSTPPQDDMYGWDRIVELPASGADGSVALDKERPRLTCYVQVKTSATISRRPRIKLSAMKHLVDTPEPAFVLWAVFGSGEEPERIWLIPVDDELMAMALKRLRQLSVEVPARQPNRVKLTLPLGSQSELQRPWPKAFREAIDKHVGESPDNYIARKSELRSSLGYGLGRSNITFTLKHGSEEEAWERLIDASLGLSPLEFADSKHVDIRFGIDVPIGNGPSGPGRLEIEPTPFDQWTVAFSRAKDAAPDVYLVGDAVAASALLPVVKEAGWDDKRLHRFRFAYPNVQKALVDFHFEASPRALRLRFRLERLNSGPHAVEIYYRLARLVELFLGSLGNTRVFFEVIGGFGPTYKDALEVKSEQADVYSTFARNIETLQLALGPGADSSPVRVTLNGIDEALHDMALLRVLIENPQGVRVTLRGKHEPQDEVVIVKPFDFQLGNYRVIRPVAIYGTVVKATSPAQTISKGHYVTVRKVVVDDSLLVESDGDGQLDVRKKAEDFAASLVTKNQIIVAYWDSASEASI